MPQSFVLFNREEGVSDSYEVRMRIWKEALRVFKTSPILGIGVGNYPIYAIKHSNTGYFIVDKEVVFYGTESGYLKILAESGVLGITVILSFVFLPIINGIRAYLKKMVNYNVFFLLAAIFAWITSFFTSNTFDDKRIIVLLATLLCLLISAYKSGKEVYA
jgi:O-antigen ligase